MMMLSQKKLSLDAVIFDLDGTLIDSIDIYFTIVEKTMERLNMPQVSRRRIVAAAESENFNWELVLPPEAMGRKDETIDTAWAIINEIAPPLFKNNLKLVPGADRILKSMSSNGLKIGLATSTQGKYLKAKMQPLKHAGVENLFEAIITSDDVPNRKPDPDSLIECAKRLDVNPNKCVYVGDTRTDMQAGKAAGMRTVGVLTGFDDYDALHNEIPDGIIDSIADLMDVIEV